MKVFSQNIYKFGDFRFDAERLALYYGDDLTEDVEKKSLEVLAALLHSPNELVTHDEIIEQVWRDNLHGATTTRVNQYVSKLQKIFSKYEPESRYIKNLKGRGYTFTGEVALTGNGKVQEPQPAIQPIKEATGESFLKSQYVLAVSVILLLGLLSAWMYYPQDDAQEVRQVVKDSQLYESLVLYKNPSTFKETDLDKYWTTELDLNSNYDRSKIRTAVEKLINDGRRYGDETKCEQFEFQSVEVSVDDATAVVKTLEKWFIAEYRTDGTLLKNKNVGPYFVSYVLRKIDGRWLIEKSNTARATPPAPHLISAEPVSEIIGGQQFFVNITGNDFLPEIVSIRIVGEGCPETNPCTVPNSALRKHSKLSEKVIENVPLTLASGEFLLSAQNGDSKTSNSVNLTVP